MAGRHEFFHVEYQRDGAVTTQCRARHALRFNALQRFNYDLVPADKAIHC